MMAKREVYMENRLLLAMDVDGTAVGKSCRLGAKTKEAFHEMRRRGHVLCFDSGRHSFDMVNMQGDDRLVDYDFTQLGELELAYAMTVHKSQGSEYRAVVLSAWNGSPYLLNRSVLYTAITRARELLIIVGREETVTVMTQNAKVGRRYTGLKLRLQNG